MKFLYFAFLKSSEFLTVNQGSARLPLSKSNPNLHKESLLNDKKKSSSNLGSNSEINKTDDNKNNNRSHFYDQAKLGKF